MQSEIAFHQQFINSSVCIDYLEEMRWGELPQCAYCSGCNLYISKTRRMFKCADCARQFTVRTGTIFGNSRLPIRKWFLAVYLVTAHKSGISSIQLAKRLDITQKSAWRMLQYIRGAVDGAAIARGGKRLAPLKTALTFDQVMLRIVRAAAD